MKLTTGTFEQLLNQENYKEELQKYGSLTVILEHESSAFVSIKGIIQDKIKFCKLNYKTLNNTIINLKDYNYHSETSNIVFHISKTNNLFFKHQTASGGHWSPSGDHHVSSTVFDKLRTYLQKLTKNIPPNDEWKDTINASISGYDDGFDLYKDEPLRNYLTQNKEINLADWLGNNGWDGKLGYGLKRIYWSGPEPSRAKIIASNWDQPMFWYEPSDTDNYGSVLILENIHFELSNFTDSAIRLSNYEYFPKGQISSPVGIGDPEQNANNGLVLHSVTGTIKGFTGNSTIFVSSKGWDWNGGSWIWCDGRNDYPNSCPTNANQRITDKACICQAPDPGWVGLLVFINCTMTFKDNQIGTPDIGIYHGGAAIYVKNGSGMGWGAGITYRGSTLTFKNNITYLSNVETRSYYYDLEFFYRYYAEGGGAIRTNNFYGDHNNHLTFRDNQIYVINGNGQTDYSMECPKPGGPHAGDNEMAVEGLNSCRREDCGDGAWGGGAYINDGWWNRDGNIDALNNIADWGSVGYATMVQEGSIIWRNTNGKWYDNSSQFNSTTFAGGGCDIYNVNIKNFNCYENNSTNCIPNYIPN